MRKALTVIVNGHRLIGTYHVPVSAKENSVSPKDIGVLIFNFAQLPRAGLGDMPVHMADEHARQGFHAFRFDMPGLGDSAGHQLDSVRSVWAFTEEGGHSVNAAALVMELNKQFNLRGMIVGGLCGGAITSIFAADRLPEGVLGLVLLEPSFYFVGSAGSQMPGKAPVKKGASTHGQTSLGKKFRSALKDKSSSGWLRWARRGYVALCQGRDMVMGPRFPEGINHSLVAASRRVAAKRLPMLLVTAGNHHRWLNRFQVFGRVKGKKLSFVEIEGTNHMLVPGGGKAQVIRHVNSWLTATFPGSR